MQRKFLWRVISVAGVGLAAACADQPTTVDTKPAPEMPVIQPAAGSPDTYDATAIGTAVPINGAIWTAAKDFQVGTGNLNPFLRVQADPQEQGFNTDARPVSYDQKTDGNFTTSLPLNWIPVINKGGKAWREFILDANEENKGTSAQFSVDVFTVWLCHTTDAKLFNNFIDFENNAKCARVWRIDDGPSTSADGTDGDWIQATDANSKGSGSSFDYEILIPEANFEQAKALAGITDECEYLGSGAPACDAFVIVKTKFGYQGGEWITGATFEELSTLDRPWISVSKTATAVATQTYKWDIKKSVDPTVITQFEGQSQDATWTVKVSPVGDPVLSGATVSGVITLVNNTAQYDRKAGKTITVKSLSDVISGYPAITVTGCAVPFDIAEGATKTCSYTVTAPNVLDGTNVATVGIDANLTVGEGLDPSLFKATKDFKFTVTKVDENPPVYDKYQSEVEKLLGNASTGTFTYKKTYTCNADGGKWSNTARVEVTGADPTASASLQVNCLTLTVTKTANTYLTRTYQWTLAKTASPDWKLFTGEKGTSEFTITVAAGSPAYVDGGYKVDGKITIWNENSLPVYIQSLPTDVLTIGGSATVTGCYVASDLSGPKLTYPYTLAAGAKIYCGYEKTSGLTGTNTTNTATVNAKPTETGTAKNFTGTATVDFTKATPTEVDKNPDLYDKYENDAEVKLGTASTGTFKYTKTYTCDADKNEWNNTARLDLTAGADLTKSAKVTVDCYNIKVEKTAATSYRRDWTWTIDKSADQSTLKLALGQTFLVNYEVKANATSKDDLHKVAGDITITNNHPTRKAEITGVTDLLSNPAVAAAVICPVTFPYEIAAAGGTLKCTYSKDLDNKYDGTNTATGTQQLYQFDKAGSGTKLTTKDYQGTKAYAFGSPSVETDECANFSDTMFDPLSPSTICASGSSKVTLPYSWKMQKYLGGYQVCGDYKVDNTAAFVTNDNKDLGSDSWSVSISIDCPKGCTLTQGYWKTHNALFGVRNGVRKGPPIHDWSEINPAWQNYASWKFFGGTPAPAAGQTPVATPVPGEPTWYTTWVTPPKGNPFYPAAHQFMAAMANAANGASTSAIDTELASAYIFFKGLNFLVPTTWSATDAENLKAWNSLFASYNEGAIGPGHCSEDKTSAP